jgi:ribosomal protein L4
MGACLVWMVLGAAAAAAQLDLDCGAPERARALIEYARLSEIEQSEDIHRDALDKALASCQLGAGREACRAEQQRQADLEWERKLAGIKARYEKMHKDFEERCRASIARAGVGRR